MYRLSPAVFLAGMICTLALTLLPLFFDPTALATVVTIGDWFELLFIVAFSVLIGGIGALCAAYPAVILIVFIDFTLGKFLSAHVFASLATGLAVTPFGYAGMLIVAYARESNFEWYMTIIFAGFVAIGCLCGTIGSRYLLKDKEKGGWQFSIRHILVLTAWIALPIGLGMTNWFFLIATSIYFAIALATPWLVRRFWASLGHSP